MKNLLIILLFISSYCQGQHIVNGQRFTSHPFDNTMILIDLGGNGVGDRTLTDNGVMTPDNTAREGQATDGRYWNNITNGFPGTLLSNPVDTANNRITGFAVAIDDTARGNFSTTDSSINFGGYTTGAVGIFPVTATRDNMYFHYSVNGGTSGTHGISNWTFTIPSGYSADVTFWGSRVGTTGSRILEFKKSTDGSWTTGYEALNNSTFSQSTTITGLSGTSVINIRVAAGLTNGHISAMIIKLHAL